MALPIYDNIPELGTQAQAIARRRKIAEMMMARGQEQQPANQMVGGIVAPVSFTQGLAQLANAYVGRKQAEDADKQEQGLANQRQKMVADELAKITQTAQGVTGVEGIQAQPERTIQAPTPMQPNQVAPNYNTVPEIVPAVAGREAIPAVKGNKRQAIMQAVMSNLPEVQKYGTAMLGFEEMDIKNAQLEAARLQAIEQKKLDREARMAQIQAQIDSREMMGQQTNDLRAAMANLQAETRMDVASMLSADRRYAVDNKVSNSANGKPMTEQQRLKFQKGMADDYKNAEQTMQTMAEIENSISTLKGSKGLSKREGYSGYLPPQIQGKEAMTAENRLQTLKGKVTQMGKAMATMSGAIGPMAVQEWKIVSDAVNAIDPTAGNLNEQLNNIEAQAKGAASRVKDIYERTYGDNFESLPQFDSTNFKIYPSNTDQQKSGTITPAGG